MGIRTIEMIFDKEIWYHGSPVLFDEFKLGQTVSSRLGDAKSIYLTKSFELAKAFSRNKSGKGYVYTVEVSKSNTGRLHNMLSLTQYWSDDKGKDTKLTCLQIYNTSEIKIINRKEI